MSCMKFSDERDTCDTDGVVSREDAAQQSPSRRNLCSLPPLLAMVRERSCKKSMVTNCLRASRWGKIQSDRSCFAYETRNTSSGCVHVMFPISRSVKHQFYRKRFVGGSVGCATYYLHEYSPDGGEQNELNAVESHLPLPCHVQQFDDEGPE